VRTGFGAFPARVDRRPRRPACGRRAALLLVALVALVGAGLALRPAAVRAAGDDIAITDAALAATVLGARPEERWSVPDRVPVKVRRLELPDARPVPPVFWYHEGLEYSLALQDGPAPWVFVIAGTGSGWDAAKMRFLQAATWKAGFHSVAISSPTHPNFMVSASSSGLPGILSRDAADLYRVMEAIVDQWGDDAPPQSFSLIGYSLGATEAAGLAHLDRERGRFQFARVALLNPAVDTYASSRRLDDLLARRFPDGEDDVARFLDRITQAFGEIYQELPGTDVLSDDFLYAAALGPRQPTRATLEGLVAIAFRVAGMDMAFTADVLRGGGAIVEQGTQLGRYTSLTRWLRPSSRFDFDDYVQRILLPELRKSQPQATLEAVARASSLYPLAEELAGDPRVAVWTSDDDFILSQAELDWLRAIFGARLHVAGGGGHLGAVERRETMQSVLEHLQGGRP
jgi:acetyl esterase/lipase